MTSFREAMPCRPCNILAKPLREGQEESQSTMSIDWMQRTRPVAASSRSKEPQGPRLVQLLNNERDHLHWGYLYIFLFLPHLLQILEKSLHASISVVFMSVSMEMHLEELSFHSSQSAECWTLLVITSKKQLQMNVCIAICVRRDPIATYFHTKTVQHNLKLLL